MSADRLPRLVAVVPRRGTRRSAERSDAAATKRMSRPFFEDTVRWSFLRQDARWIPWSSYELSLPGGKKERVPAGVYSAGAELFFALSPAPKEARFSGVFSCPVSPVPCPLAGQEEEGDRGDQVERQELDPLEPVRLSVEGDVG